MFKDRRIVLSYVPSSIVPDSLGLRYNANFQQYDLWDLIPSQDIPSRTFSGYLCMRQYMDHQHRIFTVNGFICAVFLPKHNPCQSPVEPRALFPIPVRQGEPDEALAVPQHQLVGSRPGIQWLLDTPNNDGQQVAASFPAQNLNSTLLIWWDQPWGERKAVTYIVKGASMVREYVTWAIPHSPAGSALMTGTDHYPFSQYPPEVTTEHRAEFPYYTVCSY